MKIVSVLLLAVCLGGCASYDGRGLVAGQSRAADVEALMGRPAEKIVDAAGETVWFYPHAPAGRETFAVRMRPEGTLIGIEQRLTKKNAARVVPGTTTAKEVREFFGSPYLIWRGPVSQRDIWDYPMMVDNRLADFFVELSDEGLVREAYLLHDPSYDAGNLP
jgi:hypothetical protein